ncbi:MAG: hypothetical protein JW765_09170 [Deltaproteobacteria bacterium]|nr:hypothetical protein [Candidatus Zymogenaceae bacterium]
MDRDTAREKYIALLQKHTSGQLIRETFLAEIERLRYQDEGQNWWQVTEDGTCLKWDGHAWQATGERIDAPSAAPEADTGSPPATGAKKESKAGRYFKHILMRVPFVILSFFVTWAIHTYLLAGPNGGFGQGGAGNWVFSNWRNFLSSTLLWGLLSGFVWMIVFTYFKLGKEKFIPTLTRAPAMMIERIQQAGNPGIGAIIIGTGLALFFTPFKIITGNVGFAAALFLAIFGLSSFGWAIARFIARAWLWVLRTFAKKSEKQYGINLAAAHMIMVGLIPGFVISLVLRGAFGFITGIVLIVLGIYLFFDLKAPTFSGKSGLFIFGLATLAAQVIMMTYFPDWALADNGGASEAGGWGAWWGSQGFTRVLLYGVPPSIAAALGALFPTLTPEKLVTIPPEASVPVRPDTELIDSLKFNDIATESFTLPTTFISDTPRWDAFSDMDGEVSLKSDFFPFSTTVSEFSPKVFLLNTLTKGLWLAGFACDTAMSALSNVTGPCGQALNFSYIGAKNVAGEMSDAQAKFVRGQTEYKSLSDAYKDAAVNGVMKGAIESAAEIGGGLIGKELGFNKYASGIYDLLHKNKILTKGTTSGLLRKLAGFQKDTFQYFTKYTRMDLRHGVDLLGDLKKVVSSIPGETLVQAGGEVSKLATDPFIDAVVGTPNAPQGGTAPQMYAKPKFVFRR